MPINKSALIRYQIIDECIRNKYKPYPSVQELQEACIRKLDKDISISMIQKDINAMKDVHLYDAPIKFSREKNGYYYADPNYAINKIPLNEEEIEALEFAAGIIKKYKDTSIGGSFNMAVDKVITWLKTEKYERDKRTSRIIFPEKNLNFKGTERIDLFVHCIINKIPVSFIHYSFQDQRFKSCVVHPYFLKEHHSRWYLAGYSEMHKGIRIFGLDRIEDVVMLKKKYHETPDLNPEEMFKNSIGVFVSKGKKIPEITIEFNDKVAGYIKTQPLHESQEIIEYLDDGGIIVKLKVHPDEEFYQMILSYGDNAVVMFPQEIRWDVEHRHGDATIESLYKSTQREEADEIRQKHSRKNNNS